MDLRELDAIIFDLGGVILDIDYQKTANAFKQLGLNSFDEMYSQAAQSGLFDRFEIGEISSSFFLNQLLNYLPRTTTANQLVSAWNAMLLDFPPENLVFLKEINARKKTFLLSNTNEIHIQAFNRKLRQLTGENSLKPYFNQIYFSNEIGKRKPHPEIFQFVCAENELNPSRTLFIDDSIQHIEGAKKIGLQTFHFQNQVSLSQLFTL